MAKYYENIRIFGATIDLPAMDTAAEAETIKATVTRWINDSNPKDITDVLQIIETYGAAIIMSAYAPNHYSMLPKAGSLLGAVKQHGGSRPGAGRPPAKIARQSVRFSLTDAEKALVKQYIESIR
jgi:ribonucleotide monophosphatase NagD (HAD superfamily)